MRQLVHFEGLASHEEDKDDNNLPRMVWLALEPMVPDNSAKALALAAKAKLPRLQEFVPRRMLAGKTPIRSSAEAEGFQGRLAETSSEQAAPNFTVNDSGVGWRDPLRYLP